MQMPFIQVWLTGESNGGGDRQPGPHKQLPLGGIRLYRFRNLQG
jgi:hypothetical protein